MRYAVHDLVVVDIGKRREKGLEEYGQELRADNGRDALWDGYEEALDLACYVRQALAERDGETDKSIHDLVLEDVQNIFLQATSDELKSLYRGVLDFVYMIRKFIAERDGELYGGVPADGGT